MKRKKQGNNEAGHARYDVKYSTVEQLQELNASKFNLILKQIKYGWAKISYNGEVNLSRVSAANPDVTPQVINKIYKEFVGRNGVENSNIYINGNDQYRLNLGGNL